MGTPWEEPTQERECGTLCGTVWHSVALCGSVALWHCASAWAWSAWTPSPQPVACARQGSQAAITMTAALVASPLHALCCPTLARASILCARGPCGPPRHHRLQLQLCEHCPGPSPLRGRFRVGYPSPLGQAVHLAAGQTGGHCPHAPQSPRALEPGSRSPCDYDCRAQCDHVWGAALRVRPQLGWDLGQGTASTRGRLQGCASTGRKQTSRAQ